MRAWQEGIDPDRLEARQIACQPPHPPAHPRHLSGRGQAQAFQHRNQLCRRLFGHEFVREMGVRSTPHQTKVAGDVLRFPKPPCLNCKARSMQARPPLYQLVNGIN